MSERSRPEETSEVDRSDIREDIIGAWYERPRPEETSEVDRSHHAQKPNKARSDVDVPVVPAHATGLLRLRLGLRLRLLLLRLDLWFCSSS